MVKTNETSQCLNWQLETAIIIISSSSNSSSSSSSSKNIEK